MGPNLIITPENRMGMFNILFVHEADTPDEECSAEEESMGGGRIAFDFRAEGPYRLTLVLTDSALRIYQHDGSGGEEVTEVPLCDGLRQFIASGGKVG